MPCIGLTARDECTGARRARGNPTRYSDKLPVLPYISISAARHSRAQCISMRQQQRPIIQQQQEITNRLPITVVNVSSLGLPGGPPTNEDRIGILLVPIVHRNRTAHHLLALHSTHCTAPHCSHIRDETNDPSFCITITMKPNRDLRHTPS
ncbi:hypothetical protein BU24DRAFT_135061 [Aaosphaeria arxii CBS 175.79]|uniref:Uncharacterized protein n=1 Tax=Aaosphaeria arxii CBS 175.79 TaxID=1450172 RepID=A0A6A5Y3X0_9PLEO|nr:uncharacterized protein BU24DRAFT_135061 [Aaosphaeria arxii CBS 175.79]KAF2020188.1 hypothetical protein BU24DRAFT_135061 [Aaosphaeria arxii CBS 175.79]